jgi:2-polyprenyl-6-methoxyphenol hydroxylase-like FAD-dependent oxidoreductase
MLFLGPEGTVGVAPVHATLPLWNVTVVVDPEEEGARVKVDPGAFVEAALAALPLSWTSPPTLEGGPWASGPFDWPSARSGSGRVLFVGDAAGYYDPLTGQGIFRALRSAELASGRVDQVLRGGQSVAQAVEEHGASLRRAFGPGRTVQRLVEAVISSELPRDVALRHLARGNRLDALIRVTGDAAPVRTLLHPMLWLPRPGRPGTPHSERT